jgi:hypothetical protein
MLPVMKVDRSSCLFCGSQSLRLAYAGDFHKRKKDYGPFDLHQCRVCGSAVTLSPPSPDELAAFYRSMTQFGMSHTMRAMLDAHPEAAGPDMSVRRLVKQCERRRDDSFTWIDIGAGAGEMAEKLASHFPFSRGIAVDIHDRPPQLVAPNVEWHRIDIASRDWSKKLPGRAEIVYATGVWEHVIRPDIFARNAVSLLAPEGVLYMTTPNYASLARRLLGRHWPYYVPGEHICMPTPRGARLCLRDALWHMFGPDVKAKISARAILIRYSPSLVLTKLGLRALASVCPNRPHVYLPSGAMESVVRLS